MNSLIIFISRIIGILLGTIRIKYISENKKIHASLFGFFEMIVFCLSIGYTIKEFTVLNIISYAAGMAVGTYLGMLLKESLETRNEEL